MTEFVIIDDGQTQWVAERAALIAALDALGWEHTWRSIYPARIEPADANPGEAYAELCRRVPALEAGPDEEMSRLSWYPAENAWLWERP